MRKKVKIDSPVTVGNAFRDSLGELDHEEAWCLFLTSVNTVICTDMLAKGTLSEVSIDCRTVMRQCLLNNAARVILVHNHPSGDPMPSKNDINFTSRLRFACDMIDIKLLDHIIITKDSFFSFERQKKCKFE